MTEFTNWFNSFIEELPIFDIHEHLLPQVDISNSSVPRINELLSRSYIGNFDFYPGLLQSNCAPISLLELPKDIKETPNFIDNVIENADYDYLTSFNEGIKRIYKFDLIYNHNEKKIIEFERSIKTNYNQDGYLINGLTTYGNIKYVLLDVFHSQFGLSFNENIKLKNKNLDNHKNDWNNMNNNRHPQFLTSIRLNSLLYGFNPDLWNPKTFLPKFLIDKKIIKTIPDNFDEYLIMIDKFLEWSKNKNNNVTSFKLANEYERTTDFGPSSILNRFSYSKLNSLFDSSNLKNDANNNKEQKNKDIIEFGNYIMHYLLSKMNNASNIIPLQIHTGMAIKEGSHPKNLESILNNYGNIKFDLLHSGFPWLDNTLDIISKYSNAYTDLVWVPQLSISKTTAYLTKILKLKLQDKIIGFGGDTGCLEGSIGALQVLKKVFSKVFENGFNKLDWDKADISKITKELLISNAEKFFLP